MGLKSANVSHPDTYVIITGGDRADDPGGRATEQPRQPAAGDRGDHLKTQKGVGR